MTESASGGARERRVIYSVAMSLDGYIAGPNGEYDWIVHDPDIDFAAIFAAYDTLLIGRKTYEIMQKDGKAGSSFMPGVEPILVSRTVKPVDYPNVRIERDAAALTRELKTRPGKDIWLFGGGDLFRNLLGEGLVDGVEAAIMPVLVGGGIPFLPEPAARTRLALRGRRVYEKSGIVFLRYDVVRGGVHA